MTFDAIVVPGARLAEDGSPGPALAARLRTAARAFHAGHAPLVVVSGAGESGAMRAGLLAEGVPEAAILVEASARSTRENALASARLLHEWGARRVLVATQTFHMRRCLGAFARAGLAPTALPADERPPRFAQRLKELGARAIYRLCGWS
jgi:uncharacterized SAM-binding protein YcdF (DUF218 family)